VSGDVRELDLLVLNVLMSEGLDAVSIVPGSSCRLEEGMLDDMDVSKFRQFFDLGITPVTFGDVVLDSVRGFGICSGDQLMMRLAEELRPDRVIFVTDVDGVFTSDPHDDPEARLIERLDRSSLDRLPRSERCDDVTGSIFAKIEFMLQISRHSKECIIINGNVPGRLRSALQGDADLCCSRVGGG
jgi:isopentenyl phosphate kinase